ncbi:OmpA family protein [Inquilinus sp. CA228]|uniref:OmpA family protein n=1 Tax=Inquilinus sp. CA228 TaxID=3455609 RepID=UPI003F8D1C5B
MSRRLMHGVAAAAILAAAPAMAQQATGVYVGAGAGANILQDNDFSVKGSGANRSASYDPGPAGNIYLGYDWGSFRADAEISLRSNDVDSVKSSSGTIATNGHQRTIGIMANGYYDFEFGSPIVPYIGAGVGVAMINQQWKAGGTTFSDFDTAFAYQGIAGVSYSFAPNMAATVEYRYLGTTAATFSDGGVSVKADSTGNHTVLVGLRYTFGADEAPVPQEVAQISQARSYLVFFDFDSSKLTPEARQIVASAAADALQGNSARIDVTGHTDRSGSDKYNQALSTRRAEAVRRELVADGVADGLIVTRGVGEADPLIPTADGVREPQNRRVEIVLN